MIVWKAVVGYEGLYEVSNTGLVRGTDRQVKTSRGNKTRLWKGKLRKTQLTGRGYNSVALSKDGKATRLYVHRLVAMAFLKDSNETVNHIDGNKLNNNVDNLEWLSNVDNIRHSFGVNIYDNS